MTEEAPVFLSLQELSDLLNVNKRTVRQWIMKGYIPKHSYIKADKTFRFDQAKVLAALMRHNLDNEGNTPEQLELDLDSDA